MLGQGLVIFSDVNGIFRNGKVNIKQRILFGLLKQCMCIILSKVNDWYWSPNQVYGFFWFLTKNTTSISASADLTKMQKKKSNATPPGTPTKSVRPTFPDHLKSFYQTKILLFIDSLTIDTGLILSIHIYIDFSL